MPPKSVASGVVAGFSSAKEGEERNEPQRHRENQTRILGFLCTLCASVVKHSVVFCIFVSRWPDQSWRPGFYSDLRRRHVAERKLAIDRRPLRPVEFQLLRLRLLVGRLTFQRICHHSDTVVIVRRRLADRNRVWPVPGVE